VEQVTQTEKPKRQRRPAKRLPDPLMEAFKVLQQKAALDTAPASKQKAALLAAIEVYNTTTRSNEQYRKGKWSRPKRWGDACSRASDGLGDLVDIQQEYNDWLENMPDSLKQGPTGQALEAIEALDIESAKDTVEEAEGVELPGGFAG
jgi:hypothetical protein